MSATKSHRGAPSRAPAADGAQAGARAFASRRQLTQAELIGAPLRWPRPSRLDTELELPARRMAAAVRSLGLRTVGDLLEHLPSDSREARNVAALRAGEQATVSVQVRAIAARPVRRRGMRPLVEATVFDATGAIRATFFNQPWLVDRYPPGTRVLLHGKPDARGGFRVSHHAPAAGQQQGTPAEGGGDAVAHYPATEGITSTQILTLVQGSKRALDDVAEVLPAATRTHESLPDRAGALAAMHFPRVPEDLERGRRRLAFEELLLAQLALLRRRAQRRAIDGAPRLDGEPTLSARWLRQLPFAPTRDQLAAIETVAGDLRRSTPMQRLLMGEVGSGKTVVALHAKLRAVEHRRQAALMAPTETLAEQHFATIQRLMGAEPLACELLTGSTPARKRADILGKLASGELPLVVGTHALIEPDVRFQALAVAVVDEQHRFGVRQRTALAERQPAGPPHTLHMTATPIPRTLALARYGDLDRTVLRELPRGRRPVDTRLACEPQERERAYEQLRAQLRQGRQAFVVCPLVEEALQDDGSSAQTAGPAGERSDGGLRAATAELARLRDGELEGYRLALLHGAMPPRDKQQAMAAFADGEADVLVATTVIEVGIDVPNATVMLIENAERFGISQLHQLRGRVGRGEHAACCFLLGSGAVWQAGAQAAARLRALVEHTDGFELAEIDLRLRKQGELIGTRQSGLAGFEVARLPDDADLLERARKRAEAIISADPQLTAPEHGLLGRALERRFGGEALEPIPA